jgi:hypothetical protein
VSHNNHVLIAEVFTNAVTNDNGDVNEESATAADVVNIILGVLRSDPFPRQSAVSDYRHRVTIDPETGGITIWREKP